MVVEEAKKIEQKLDEMAMAEEQQELLKRLGPNASVNKQVAYDDGYGDSLENPDVAKSIGRPTIAGRHKTIAEMFRTKQTISCSHCGAHNHNYATCEQKHLDKSLFQKRNTNQEVHRY